MIDFLAAYFMTGLCIVVCHTIAGTLNPFSELSLKVFAGWPILAYHSIVSVFRGIS